MILNYRTTNSCSSLADMTYLDKSHPRTQNCFLKEKFNELIGQPKSIKVLNSSAQPSYDIIYISLLLLTNEGKNQLK